MTSQSVSGDNAKSNNDSPPPLPSSPRLSEPDTCIGDPRDAKETESDDGDSFDGSDLDYNSDLGDMSDDPEQYTRQRGYKGLRVFEEKERSKRPAKQALYARTSSILSSIHSALTLSFDCRSDWEELLPWIKGLEINPENDTALHISQSASSRIFKAAKRTQNFTWGDRPEAIGTFGAVKTAWEKICRHVDAAYERHKAGKHPSRKKKTSFRSSTAVDTRFWSEMENYTVKVLDRLVAPTFGHGSSTPALPPDEDDGNLPHAKGYHSVLAQT